MTDCYRRIATRNSVLFVEYIIVIISIRITFADQYCRKLSSFHKSLFNGEFFWWFEEQLLGRRGARVCIRVLEEGPHFGHSAEYRDIGVLKFSLTCELWELFHLTSTEQNTIPSYVYFYFLLAIQPIFKLPHNWRN